MYNISDFWSIDKLNSDFLETGLVLVSATHFVYDFVIKIFRLLYSIH